MTECKTCLDGRSSIVRTKDCPDCAPVTVECEVAPEVANNPDWAPLFGGDTMTTPIDKTIEVLARVLFPVHPEKPHNDWGWKNATIIIRAHIMPVAEAMRAENKKLIEDESWGQRAKERFQKLAGDYKDIIREQATELAELKASHEMEVGGFSNTVEGLLEQLNELKALALKLAEKLPMEQIATVITSRDDFDIIYQCKCCGVEARHARYSMGKPSCQNPDCVAVRLRKGYEE